MFCNLRCLRVLSLYHFISFKILPSSIYKLKHLRHLDLSENHDIKKLPDSITNLQNLQVLNLSGCTSLQQLPDNITKLVNLTDLLNDECPGLTHMPRGIGEMTRLEQLSLFVIKEDNSIPSKHSSELDELHGLNNLRGSLEIKNLKHEKKIACEFKAANLNEKEKLQRLTLRWKEGDDGNCSVSDVCNDEMGLEALSPHQNLKDLGIRFYRGARPPSWLPSLTNLVSVTFRNCGNIQWLPRFDHLPYLKSLWVSALTKLEHIDLALNREKGGSPPFFPSLSDLELVDCPNLKGFVRCETDDVGTKPSLTMEELRCFPCLSKLEIRGCPNLTGMPFFPEIKTLRLGEDGIKSLMKVLKRATASALESTSSPAFSTLSQLVDLTILGMEDCAVDELLPYLTSLQSLSFSYCPCESLSSDEKDDGLQWQNLKVLQSLRFSGLSCLVSLPKGLQYVTTLQRLEIYRCVSLVSIPEWMGNLTSLQSLTICAGPQLSERCKNNTAEDWPKISHIPNIKVQYKDIQRNGCYLL